MTVSPRSCSRRWKNCALATACRTASPPSPLIDEKAVAKVEEHIADAIAKGAKVVTGGKPHALGGSFFSRPSWSTFPTAPKWRKRETFGPLAPLFRFKDEADVIARPTIPSSVSPPAFLRPRSEPRLPRRRSAGVRHNRHQHRHYLHRSRAVRRRQGLRPRPRRVKYGIEDFLEIKYMCIGL